MQSRNEDYGCAKQFFIEILKILNCKKIKIEQIEIDGTICLVCGFSSYNSKIISSILSVFPECKFNSKDNNYIVTVSARDVKDKLNNFFKRTVESLDLPCGGFIRENKFHITDSTYDSMCRDMDVKNNLSKAGLGLREDIVQEEAYDFHMPIRYESKKVKMITIDGYSSFKKFIFAIPDSSIKNILFEQAKKIKAKTFCLGLKFDNTSMLSALKTSEMFDTHVITEMFEFDSMRDSQNLDAHFPFFNAENKDSEDYNVLPAHLTAEEIEISDHIETLTDEMGCSYSDVKKSKMQFLSLLLVYKRVSSNLSLKQCLEFAKKTEPELYKKAISGIFWTRTDDLLNKILGHEKHSVTPSSLPLHRWKM